MTYPSHDIQGMTITWLKEQDDQVINYALAKLYWSKHLQLTPQQRARATYGRALAHGTQTQSRSRAHRANRSARALLALNQPHVTPAALPQTQGRFKSELQYQKALKSAYEVIDQMNDHELTWSLHACLERALEKRKLKTKFKADEHTIYEADLSFLTWIKQRNNAHDVLNSLLENLKERPDDQKTHEKLIKELDQLIYYAFVLDRPLQTLINDEDIYQTFTQSLESAGSSIEELHAVVRTRQQSAQSYSWVKLFSRHIGHIQTGNHTTNPHVSDEHFDVVKRTDEKDTSEASSEHTLLAKRPVEWVLAEAARELIEDEALSQHLFFTEKHRGHRANYELWLETLREHLNKIDSPPLGVYPWRFNVKTYPVKSLQKRIGHKPLARLREHVTTKVEELISKTLTELSVRDELGKASVTAWLAWCEQIEVLSADTERARIAEQLLIKLNLNDLNNMGKLSIMLRSSLEHEKLCESHVECDYEVTHSAVDLDQEALRHLCYLASVITLINSVTRLRKGSSRVKDEADP